MRETADRPAPVGASAVAPTTISLFLQQAELLGDRPMLHHYRDDRWQAISWVRAREGVVRIANALLELGVLPGERVVILSENRPEWILCDLAIQGVGGVTVPIYPTLTPAGANQIARDSGARVAIVSAAPAAAALRSAGSVRTVVSMDDVRGLLDADPTPDRRALVADRAARVDASDLATV
ncbi:MAG TPA: AMP-binding protein, partial [Candidatus Limnocylindrales bacterium]|nr:AMP-binding protein [Candidatus Limnocylindrales bacterium]